MVACAALGRREALGRRAALGRERCAALVERSAIQPAELLDGRAREEIELRLLWTLCMKASEELRSVGGRIGDCDGRNLYGCGRTHGPPVEHDDDPVPWYQDTPSLTWCAASQSPAGPRADWERRVAGGAIRARMLCSHTPSPPRSRSATRATIHTQPR